VSWGCLAHDYGAYKTTSQDVQGGNISLRSNKRSRRQARKTLDVAETGSIPNIKKIPLCECSFLRCICSTPRWNTLTNIAELNYHDSFLFSLPQKHFKIVIG
jgi:hypothetical protein